MQVTVLESHIPLGYVQVTDTDTAFAAPAPDDRAALVLVVVQVEDQAMRWRDDGVDPTTTVGMRIPVGGELIYTGNDVTRLKLIAETAGAIANFSFYGMPT